MEVVGFPLRIASARPPAMIEIVVATVLRIPFDAQAGRTREMLDYCAPVHTSWPSIFVRRLCPLQWW